MCVYMKLRFLFLVPALLASPISALVIRHDTPTLDYENYGKESQFNASANIYKDGDPEFGSLAGSTAIDSRWGVHARHTLRSVSDWLDDGKVARLRGTRWKGVYSQGLGGVVVNQVIHYDDDFSRFSNAIDIALVQTKSSHSALRIAPLFGGWDEVGRVGSGVSGANNRNNGNGVSTKPEAQATSNSNRWYEVRWGGKNDIDVLTGSSFQGSPSNAILQLDFDHPTNTSKSKWGGNTAIDLEYGSMNGDSGSPLYVDKNGVEAQIAGVLSGGSGNVYGSSVIYVRTRAYKNWITDTVLANPDNRTLGLAAIPNQVVNLGDTVNLTAVASGSELPPQSVTYSLVGPPDGAGIDPASGEFTWIPGVSQANTTQTITVMARENGVAANSVTTEFDVSIVGSEIVDFWSWSGGQPAWQKLAGSNSYALGGSFPYLQGDSHHSIYHEIPGTIPPWATVAITLKIADFHQSWTSGGAVEFGFYDGEPDADESDAEFLFSSIADVPNYNGDELVDGLGNTGGNVEYGLIFETTEELVNPWIAVRKNFAGGRVGVDDVQVSYYFQDQDEDGLPDSREISLGTDPLLADTDGDGLEDGDEVAAQTDPLDRDSDHDGFADGYEVQVLFEDPLDPESPGGPNPLAIGINFSSIRGQEAGVARTLPATAYAGVPEVAQKNWNQTSALNVASQSTLNIGSILTPNAGKLVDSRGDETEVGLSFMMNNSWNIDNEQLTPYGSLFAGYLDTNSVNNASVTLSNIPFASYDLYVYLGAGNVGSTQKITDGQTTYSFSTAARVSDAGTYLQTRDTGEGYPSANYAKFEGRTSSSATVTFLRGSSNGGINAVQIVAIEPLSPYEEWASGYAMDVLAEGAPTADADGDGSSNLLEFVLLSDPLEVTSQVAYTHATTESGSTMNFVRARDTGAYVTKVTWSEDLLTWSDQGVILEETDLNEDETEVRATIPWSPNGERYFRIEVSAP